MRTLVGKEVFFSVDYKVNSGREFCRVFAPDESGKIGENMAEKLVGEGYAEVRVGPKGHELVAQ